MVRGDFSSAVSYCLGGSNERNPVQTVLYHAVAAVIAVLLLCVFKVVDWDKSGWYFLVGWFSSTLYSVLYVVCGWVKRKLTFRLS